MARGKKTGGRTAGTPNKFTIGVKETVLHAFIALQEDPKVNIQEFGRTNPVEFYKIAAKLIPTEVNATISEVKISVNRKINPE